METYKCLVICNICSSMLVHIMPFASCYSPCIFWSYNAIFKFWLSIGSKIVIVIIAILFFHHFMEIYLFILLLVSYLLILLQLYGSVLGKKFDVKVQKRDSWHIMSAFALYLTLTEFMWTHFHLLYF